MSVIPLYVYLLHVIVYIEYIFKITKFLFPCFISICHPQITAVNAL
jgi:hypothetical protein